jgi:glycolate oxidase FAD binding subunit
VIGITAVDGRGVTFHAGGRVVKNVAGYDLCKLLCGSLGTLAVITQVTLKLKPLPPASAFVIAPAPSLELAEKLLTGLVNSGAMPTAIELLQGPAWQADAALHDQSGSVNRVRLGAGPTITSKADAVRNAAALAAGLEGTAAEVEWMIDQLRSEFAAAGIANPRVVQGEAANALWGRLAEFPAAEPAALVLKSSALPSATTQYIEQLLAVDPGCSIQAHAGNGIVLARMTLSPAEATQALIKSLQPAAAAAQGNVVVLAWPDGMELTRRVAWGNAPADLPLMQAVKSQFDPQGLLNPGRFVV